MFAISLVCLIVMVIAGAYALSKKASISSAPMLVQNPRIGFLNLIGESAYPEMSQDKEGIGFLFRTVFEWKWEPKECDILFLYCNLERNGDVENYWGSLGQIFDRSKAKIVVIATNNHPKSYAAAGKRADLGGVNLVMTIERNGERFADFFKCLFQNMLNGISMPSAWVELAPQRQQLPHTGTPETIFSCGAGSLVIKNHDRV